MKNIILYILVIAGLWASCGPEEIPYPIYFPAPTNQLVVEADFNINAQLPTDTFIRDSIILSLPSLPDDIMQNKRWVESDAQVFVTMPTNPVREFEFKYTINGIYVSDSFFVRKVNGATYNLRIIYNGDTYTATAQYNSVPPVDSVTYDGKNAFDFYQHTIYYRPTAVNQSFFFVQNYKATNPIEVNWRPLPFSDTNSVNGLPISFDPEAEGNPPNKRDIGDTVYFSMQQPYPDYFSYLTILNTNIEQNSFTPPPAPAFGNIQNTTNTTREGRPLGYFSVLETNFFSFVVGESGFTLQ